VEQARDKKGVIDSATNHNAIIHDFDVFRSMLDSLMNLAQYCLIGIIRNKKRLVDALPRDVNRHRAQLVASSALTPAARL
jgi:hypothetical protein